jgi:hypothetical protein
MKAYYLEDGSGGRLRVTCFQESETSHHLGEQPLEYVSLTYPKAFHTDDVLKGRTTTCVWWGGWTSIIIRLN